MRISKLQKLYLQLFILLMDVVLLLLGAYHGLCTQNYSKASFFVLLVILGMVTEIRYRNKSCGKVS